MGSRAPFAASCFSEDASVLSLVVSPLLLLLPLLRPGDAIARRAISRRALPPLSKWIIARNSRPPGIKPS